MRFLLWFTMLFLIPQSHGQEIYGIKLGHPMADINNISEYTFMDTKGSMYENKVDVYHNELANVSIYVIDGNVESIKVFENIEDSDVNRKISEMIAKYGEPEVNIFEAQDRGARWMNIKVDEGKLYRVGFFYSDQPSTPANSSETYYTEKIIKMTTQK